MSHRTHCTAPATTGADTGAEQLRVEDPETIARLLFGMVTRAGG